MSTFVQADCGERNNRVIRTNVQSCIEIVPAEHEDLRAKLKDFDDKDKTEIVNSYQGYEVGTSYGRLFIPLKDGFTCSNIKIGKEIIVEIGYACCDGDPNPPCYLGYSELVEHFK